MSCNNSTNNNTPLENNLSDLTITERDFGAIGNDSVSIYIMKNENGVSVEITKYGGIITKIITPGRYGEFADIALGFDSLSEYVENTPYFGAFVG